MAKSLFVFVALVTIQCAFSASFNFTWCTLSTAEKAKCADFIKYVNMTARNNLSMDVTVDCVIGKDADDCIAKIKDNEADLVTLDGGDLYKAGKNSGHKPIVSEIYEIRHGVKHYDNYKAVAVVMKNNTGFNFTSLMGKKSCHTGVRRTAGWNVPIGYLLRSKLMPAVACGNANNDFMSASKFFSESCVPGIDRTAYSNLCALCAGSGADKCSKSIAKNKYAEYIGAFKCMADGKGDVAFVKHTTTEEVVKSGGYKTLADYEYLCKDGTRKAIGEHETCNLGNSPAHAVVTKKGNANIAKIIQILKAMSDMYGVNQTDWKQFQLFNSTTYGGSNLLFKDSATELVGIPSAKQTYMAFLGADYVNDLEALKTCPTCMCIQTTTAPPKAVATVTSPITQLVLLIALFGVLFL